MCRGTIDSLLPSTQSGMNLRIIFDRLDVEPRNVLKDRQDVLFRPIGDVFEFWTWFSQSYARGLDYLLEEAESNGSLTLEISLLLYYYLSTYLT